jgi:hypothetical protein
MSDVRQGLESAHALDSAWKDSVSLLYAKLWPEKLFVIFRRFMGIAARVNNNGVCLYMDLHFPKTNI